MTRLVRVVLLVVLVAGTLTGLSATAPPADALAAQAVVFRGGGWGHGVGMPQYGAYGQAVDGVIAKQIVTHYYTGTAVESVDGLGIDPAYLGPPRPLWIGLAQDRSTADVTITQGDAKVCFTPGEGCADAPITETGETLTVFVTAAGGACKVKRDGVVLKDGDGVAMESPGCRIRIDPLGAGRVTFDGGEYRRGVLEFRFAPGTSLFHVSAAMSLEHYLYGLAEVPSFWPTAALRAQAFAARSYAANKYLGLEDPALRAPGDAGLSSARMGECWCHLYATVLDQVYLGLAAEHAPWTAAVDATAGQVITYSGADASWATEQGVIAAFYHSSSSGVTESNVTAWGSPVALPYLAPVDDPWSADPAVNPNASWEVAVSPADVASVLGWDHLRQASLVEAAPGAVVRFDGIDGGVLVSTEKTGYQVRTLFGLKSPGLVGVDMEGPRCAGLFATHVGTSGNDTIVGTAGRDVIVGRAGADVLEGKGGDDVICGGSGGDELRGGAGADVLRGGDGIDVITGGVGNDVLRGGDGADVVKGGAGGDLLMGGDGDDVLRGQAGGDDLKGGPATDECFGGLGTDTGTGCEAVSGVP